MAFGGLKPRPPRINRPILEDDVTIQSACPLLSSVPLASGLWATVPLYRCGTASILFSGLLCSISGTRDTACMTRFAHILDVFKLTS